MGISTTNYYPEVVFGIGTAKRINIVEDIFYEIIQQYNLGLNLNNDSLTLTYKGNINERRLKLLEVEHKDDERGVIESTKILMHFIENDLLPTYDLFDDIREIDKRINGEGENYWEDDFGPLKPFSLFHFHEQRLIIAKLCNNPNFETLVEKFCNYMDYEISKNTGKPFVYDLNDLSFHGSATIDYLRKNVKPIY